MKIKLLLLLAVTGVLPACKKISAPLLSSDKELLEFKLEDNLNSAYLIETITGVIEDNEILLIIPEAVNATKLVATFNFSGAAVFVGSVVQESEVTVNDFTQPVSYIVEAEDGSRVEYVVKIEWLPGPKAVIPHLYIETDNRSPIKSKEDYVKADIRIDGGDAYEDYEGRTAIKGRGNSTWSYPKKPYRLKLDEKASLLGLSSEKDWILLANYLDESLMCNAAAMEVGRLLEMPFTHHIIPVDVTLNGVYVGNYMFTEHKEVETNRINVGDDGVLLELDTYFDESYKFVSRDYQLPVMVQFPELDELSPDIAATEFNAVKNDFETLTAAVADASFPDNDYLDLFDAEAFADYMVVYTLTSNIEINHPKSTYIYKKKGGKYAMGPIWDFDWAFGFDGAKQHFLDPTMPLFWTGDDQGKGTVFFSRLMDDPVIQKHFKAAWNDFRENQYGKLISYIDDYAEIINESYHDDYLVWHRGTDDLQDEVQQLLTWLDQRAAYMDELVAAY